MLLPTVSSTPGPLYASENNQAFLVIDNHNHTPGNGVPVPTAGININADLSFNSYNATLLRSTRFAIQSLVLSTAFDVACLYSVSGNLYYNNGIGQPIQLTVGAALNAASIGGIGGDYSTSTASVFYTSLDTTFTFWSAPNTSASIDGGPLTIRNKTSGSFGVTLNANATLSSNFGLTFFPSLPVSTKILTVDASGNIGDVYDVDNSTLQIVSNTIQVAPMGITATQIANSTITSAQIAPGGVSQANLASRSTGGTVGAGGVGVSNSTVNFTTSSPTYTNVLDGSSVAISVTITTTGRPVMLMLQSMAGGDNQGNILIASQNGFNPDTSNGFVAFLRAGTIVNSHEMLNYLLGSTTTPTYFNQIAIPPSSFTYLDQVAAGTYTYTVQVKVNSTGGTPTMIVSNTQLVAYEI